MMFQPVPWEQLPQEIRAQMVAMQHMLTLRQAIADSGGYHMGGDAHALVQLARTDAKAFFEKVYADITHAAIARHDATVGIGRTGRSWRCCE